MDEAIILPPVDKQAAEMLLSRRSWTKKKLTAKRISAFRKSLE